MDTTALDVITSDFYRALSFKNHPDYELDATEIEAFFYGEGFMIDNGFKDPVIYTAESYLENMVSLVAERDIENYMRRELSARTEFFGKIAHRTSVYEYSFDDHPIPGPTRGIAYIQFVLVDENWKIVSMIWADENEERRIEG